MAILVTGGAGYIGSHTCVELLNAGYEVVVCDNYCNSVPEVLERIKQITNKNIAGYDCDIRNRAGLEKIFSENSIEAVIHFAGLKAVGESTREPIMYYDNNISGTVTLLDVMKEYNCKSIVFSSSATVYGNNPIPYEETMVTGDVSNPYGRTKHFIEQILGDVYVSDNEWSISLLRYFNPIGAHESGIMGEDPKGIPNNLLPYIAQVAVGKLEKVHVFGNDYPTPDGTGVRDYIHVVDLAIGHVKAIEHCSDKEGVHIYNLGTGNGYSVLDIVKAFSKACGKEIPYQIDPRRPGDIAECYADPAKAKAELGWEAKRGIDEMCADSWRWQSTHPDGFGE